jgi:hypothetical protein
MVWDGAAAGGRGQADDSRHEDPGNFETNTMSWHRYLSNTLTGQFG